MFLIAASVKRNAATIPNDKPEMGGLDMSKCPNHPQMGGVWHWFLPH